MFVYLSKKIAIPNNVRLNCIAWNQKHGYIAVGGEDGLLKVIRADSGAALDTTNNSSGKSRLMTGTSNLSMNQTLEGHNGHIQVVTWNEEHQKLTSSDQNGVIIVWMLHKGSWYEEMINNRNKSLVKSMSWDASGKKICIVYEDGAVIVGSVEGNRIWGKELKNISLTAVQWSPDTKFLLFGSKSGEVYLYDEQGIFLRKLDNISDDNDRGVVALHWYNGKNGYKSIDHPTLAICFQSGKICFLKSSNDDNPIIINTNLSIACCVWNTFGSLLAVAGIITSGIERRDSYNVVYFYSAYGSHVKSLKIPGKEVTCCSWEQGSLRICFSVDSNIYFGNIRPDYKWTYFGNTIVFTDEKINKNSVCVTFWNTINNTLYFKHVRSLISLASYGEHCVIAAQNVPVHAEEPYVLYVCNAISTPVDTKFLDFEPIQIAICSSMVIVTSKSSFLVWNFRAPRNSAFNSNRFRKDRIYHIDDTPTGVNEVIQDLEKDKPFESSINRVETSDPICSISATDKLLLIGRESGMIQQYSLPQVTLTKRYVISQKPCRIFINCDSTRAAVIDNQALLRIINITCNKDRSNERLEKTSNEDISKFERKDAWSMCWAQDNPEFMAILEKSRMYVFRGLEPEEPITCPGYICSFKDLEIKCALLDELILQPDQAQSSLIVNLEVKSLRDTKELLAQVGLREAEEFVRDNPHPRLWRLIGEHALRHLELEVAENAMVHCADYLGIRFVKRLKGILEAELRRAEVFAFLGDYDEAEKVYLELDRRDLAIALRQKLADYPRALQLMRLNAGGTDVQIERTHVLWGKHLAAQQDWQDAREHLERGRALDKLLDCYYKLEEYEQLAAIAAQLPDQAAELRRAARMLASVGMCQQAVSCFVRCADVKQAVETCVRSNRWDQALELASTWRLPGIRELLAKYARYLLTSGCRLQAIELYRKADCPLEAAKLLLELADEQARRRATPLRLKKLYVLAALLVQEHLDKTRGQARAQPTHSDLLMGLAETKAEDTWVIEEAWRGAEAYHFLLLAHRQLYAADPESAMRTALRLREYEDLLDQELVYTLLALASCTSRAFATCSRAFVRLEAIDQRYEELALDIFNKQIPKDAKQHSKSECQQCETLVPDYCVACPNCANNFPACVVTGRPLMNETSNWLCSICKHRASSERDVVNINACPLCHSIITYM